MYCQNCLLDVADMTGFEGDKIEDLVEKNGGKFLGTLVKWTNNFMILSSGIGNIMFAIKFVNFFFCNLGENSVCNQTLILHIAAFFMTAPLTLIPNVGFFAIVSLMAIIFILSAILSVCAYFSLTIYTFGVNETTNMLNPPAFGEFFGVMCYSIEGLALIFPIRQAIGNNREFRASFNQIFGIVVVIYLLLGSTSTMAFGKDLKTSVLLNFDENYPSIYPQSLLYATAIFVTVPYLLFPLTRSVLSSSFINKKLAKNYWFGVFTRLFFISICILVSASGISLVDFLDISGSLCNAVIAIFMPLFIMNLVGSKNKSISKSRYYFNWALMVVGVSCSLYSCSVGVRNVMHKTH